MARSKIYLGDAENEKESAALFLPPSLHDKDGEKNGDSIAVQHHNTTTTGPHGVDGDDNDDDLVCGVGPFTPSCLQGCMCIGWFTATYSLAGLLTSALGVYISSQITTLEKYYNFSSSVSGLLMSCNDIGYLTTTLLMSYYSRRVHIPRALSLSTLIYGLSGIVCVLAYAFTKDEYPGVEDFAIDSDNGSSAHSGHTSFAQLCEKITASNTTQRNDQMDAGQMSDSIKNVAILILACGMVVQGMAKSPRPPFLGTFIDDNVPKTQTTKYIGLIGGFGIFGPALAFILGGVFSRIYVTLEDPGISVRDPRWVGAWWIGFLLFGGAAVLVALPLSCFPPRLKGRREIPELESERRDAASGDKPTTLKDVTGFVKSLRRVLTNPVYVLVVLATGVNLMGIAGLIAFAAKYMETQFTIPVFKANMTMGSLNVLSAALGTVIGGMLVSRFKLSPKACLLITIICSVMSSLSLSLSFVLGCDQPYIYTVTDKQLLADDGGGISLSGCAADCNCDTQNFFPVCGADNRIYFSPCHAGCTGVEGSNVFVNCSCVFGDSQVPAAASNQTATAGLCTPECNKFIPYVLSMFFHAFFATLTIMPNFVVYVRSVSEADKPLALGFMAFSNTVLGWLPGPMVFGYLVDTTCEIWNGAGACALYNLPIFRFRFHSFMLILRIISLILTIAVFLIVIFSKTFEFQSHTDDVEVVKGEKLKVAHIKDGDENGKYRYRAINQPVETEDA